MADDRERRPLRLIGASFFVLAAYMSVEAIRDLVVVSPGRRVRSWDCARSGLAHW
jgi:hypothetical protein